MSWARLQFILCITVMCILFAFSRHVGAACEDRQGVFGGGWSHHLIDNDFQEWEDGWNERHHAFGMYCNQWSIAHFTNSLGREAVGVGRDFVWRRTQHIDLGWYAGVWTGYEELPTDVFGMIPVITPYAEVKAGRLDLRVMANPVVFVGLIGWRF